MAVVVRRGTVPDAAGIAAVLNEVIAEGGLTVFDRPFSVDAEKEFLSTMGPRTAIHVADSAGEIVGVQVIDRLSDMSGSLSHVATLGTWIGRSARGTGIGRMLFEHSMKFAKSTNYLKIVIQVLADNERALRFYRRVGFRDIGIARRHAHLAGVYHDEVYMEMLLN